MTAIKDDSLQTYLDELASKNATPGGGSAAAFMGAQAAALISMVCHLTIGKAKYLEVEDDLQSILRQADMLRAQLMAMIQQDVDVFNQLMVAYGMPKQTDDEKIARSIAIQQILKEATLVPLACAKACVDTINLSRVVAEKGNLAVISDAGVAVMSGYAALKSAALNVHINAASLKDRAFAEQKLAELSEIERGVEETTQAIYALVKSRL